MSDFEKTAPENEAAANAAMAELVGELTEWVNADSVRAIALVVINKNSMCLTRGIYKDQSKITLLGGVTILQTNMAREITERVSKPNPLDDEMSGEMSEWQPIETAPKDGTDIVLHVDWQPLSVVGYWGEGRPDAARTDDPRGALYDDGKPTWRVRWDASPIHWGFDEPTHWAPLPTRKP